MINITTFQEHWSKTCKDSIYDLHVLICLMRACETENTTEAHSQNDITKAVACSRLFKMLSNTSCADSPLNGKMPVLISYKQTPRAHQSTPEPERIICHCNKRWINIWFTLLIIRSVKLRLMIEIKRTRDQQL